MNLQQVFRLSFISLLAIILISCGDTETYSSEFPSSDAQIYGFEVNCIPVTATDSINYPIMANTKFVIDQNKQLIYNPDSLPYKTVLKKFATTIAFSSSGASLVRLQYPDSLVVWESTSDSIDFSIPKYPKIIVTPLSGINPRTYTVDIRVHQIDPDLIVWNNVSEQIKQPESIKEQKTILKNEIFYTFSVDSDDKLYLHKATKGANYDAKLPLSGLPTADKFNLQSITLLNGSFFAVDSDQKGYVSSDGTTWTEKSSKIKSIVGVLPAKVEANDILLVITESENTLSFAKTTDLENLEIVRALNSTEKEKFPISGFSSSINIDRNNLDKNILMVTGGTNESGSALNHTWLIQLAADNTLRLIVNDEHKVFPANKGIATFMYNKNLYALTSNKLYRSISYGAKWTAAPDSESLNPDMAKASGQSVIVDNENYIWIFGGIQDDEQPVYDVWRGRLNKLNPKK